MSAKAVAEAIGSQDREALSAALAEEVVLHTPVDPEPLSGRDVVANTFLAVGASLSGFGLREFIQGDVADVARYSGFVADDAELHILQVLKVDGDGLVSEIVGSMRPLSAAEAWMQKMAAAGGPGH
jgi:hypothetical protein